MAMLLLALAALSSCRQKPQGNHHDPGALQLDSNLSQLLKPANEQVVSRLSVIKASYGSRIFTEELQGLITYDTRNEHNISSRIGGRIEQLYINFNYQPVRKGQLIMEIYSPELAAAQQELLYLHKSNQDELLNAARQKLQLLGMTNRDVDKVIRSGTPDYRIAVYSNADGYILEKSAAQVAAPAPAAAETVGSGMDNMGGGSAAPAAQTKAAGPVLNTPLMLRPGQYVAAGQSLFTIYNTSGLVAEFSVRPQLSAYIRKGDRLVFYRTADKSQSKLATVGLIQPVFKAGQSFTILRAYLPAAGFKAGELLTAKVPVSVAASWWLPEAALVAVGNSRVVFKKEGAVFVPKLVKSGLTAEGMVQVREDIGSWEISSNAAYLVDSESFIKMKENLQQ